MDGKQQSITADRFDGDVHWLTFWVGDEAVATFKSEHIVSFIDGAAADRADAALAKAALQQTPAQ
jgi:hypothetical protein